MKYNSNNKPLVCMQTQSSCYKGTTKMTVKGILWHSTGANNPKLSRYVQPSDIKPNEDTYSKTKWLEILGINKSKTDWNHTKTSAGLNCWIGKLADGSVTTVQTMPWDYKPWGCGSGVKGSCNNGWIQFEICEDALTDKAYFDAAYKEACEITAYLCKLFNLNPNGTTTINGVTVPVILCHADSYKLKLGSNHGDVLHWFKRYGKTMENVRSDVYSLLHPKVEEKPIENDKKEEKIEEEIEEMTQADFNKMMEVYLAEQGKKAASSWSKDARTWGETNGLITGDTSGNKMYKKFLTREEFISVLFRLCSNDMIKNFADDYLADISDDKPAAWSKEARDWAEKEGYLTGDTKGNKMYKKPITREELVSILYRIHNK